MLFAGAPSPVPISGCAASRSRRRYRLQYARHDLIAAYFFGLSLVRAKDAVTQNVRRNRFYVLGGDESAPAQKCVRARRLRERQRGPRASAELDERPEVLEIG